MMSESFLWFAIGMVAGTLNMAWLTWMFVFLPGWREASRRTLGDATSRNAQATRENMSIKTKCILAAIVAEAIFTLLAFLVGYEWFAKAGHR